MSRGPHSCLTERANSSSRMLVCVCVCACACTTDVFFVLFPPGLQKGFPADSTLDGLIEFWKQYGNIRCVRMRRVKGEEQLFKVWGFCIRFPSPKPFQLPAESLPCLPPSHDQSVQMPHTGFSVCGICHGRGGQGCYRKGNQVRRGGSADQEQVLCVMSIYATIFVCLCECVPCRVRMCECACHCEYMFQCTCKCNKRKCRCACSRAHFY